MVSSLLNASVVKPSSAASIYTIKFRIPLQLCPEKFRPTVSCRRKPEHSVSAKNGPGFSYTEAHVQIVIQKSLISIAAASIAIVFWSSPDCSSRWIESVPGPELPQVDFLKRFNGMFSTNYESRPRATGVLCSCLLLDTQRFYTGPSYKFNRHEHRSRAIVVGDHTRWCRKNWQIN